MATRGVETYRKMQKAFTWEGFAKETFDWNPAQRFNITHEAVDRHSNDPKKVALFYISADGKEEKYTYRELKHLTSKFANVLKKLGVEKGDRVARMLPRIPECYITFLGTWKAGAIDVPLFTAFGPEAIEYRVKDCEAKVIVTDAENREKLDRISGGLPGVEIIVVADERGLGIHKGDLSFHHEMANASREFDTVETAFEDIALLEYTSGTTGPPKGATLKHGGIITTVNYAKHVLDVKEGDMFWGFIDPGWLYGLWSAGITVLALGKSLLVYQGAPDVKAWYKTMERYEVNNFSAAPTLYRMIMAAGEDLPRQHKIKVRRLTSGGEYLNPECSAWFEKHFGVPIGDQYGLTEVAVVTVNYPFMESKPGSMGLPLLGLDVAIMDEEGNELPVDETGVVVIRKSKYFLANGYWNKPEKWQESFINGEWFNTGDLAARDEEGYLFYKGRADDIISTSGYRVGPGEVESALIRHPSVAEAAVIGKPDPKRVELIKAFVVLKPSFKPSDELAKELREFVRDRYSKHAYPREIEFLPALPKTESSKIMRRELRKRELEAMKAEK